MLYIQLQIRRDFSLFLQLQIRRDFSVISIDIDKLQIGEEYIFKPTVRELYTTGAKILNSGRSNLPKASFVVGGTTDRQFACLSQCLLRSGYYVVFIAQCLSYSVYRTVSIARQVSRGRYVSYGIYYAVSITRYLLRGVS